MQVKTLCLKGKGFKRPLKGAEIVVHRRWVRNSRYEVFRGESLAKPANLGFKVALLVLIIRHAKFSLHPLKVALCRTLLINAYRQGNS